MRQIALLGLILCVASLLMSARMADGSVGALVEKSVEILKAVEDDAAQAPGPSSAHFNLD
ncbi:hypothetical protein EOI86_06970 [Hwanghaeella grinnelliae]|uniref:Uncharacterized protein n=1 Tax=Hwanghaeella grinnelliae TaxID=2500179 RepID=A0A437QWT7_9PROT|nr:hypothetical protein [Hwanghaeella grinnelliae]RVU38995.1 hypothetical protein EOI86_06970 [Hwanghaeella grinnelliae]